MIMATVQTRKRSTTRARKTVVVVESPLKRSLRSTTMLNRLGSIGAAMVVSGVLFAAGGAHAQSVGDPVTNPVTGVVLTVTDVVPNGVIATGNIFILTVTAPGTASIAVVSG